MVTYSTSAGRMACNCRKVPCLVDEESAEEVSAEANIQISLEGVLECVFYRVTFFYVNLKT